MTIFNKEDWTCEVCGREVAPIFKRLQADGKWHSYCADHDPISKDELRRRQGMSEEIIKELNTPRRRR